VKQAAERLLPDSGNPKGKEEPSGDYLPAELPQNNRQQALVLTIGTVLLSGKNSTHSLPAEEAFLIFLF
ncbi:hypothetical protein, partial [Sutterella wadsworthensis]|uniref:hypothetical protein n=1 Tax=Sutterella wadsworthensis TaxID=40545 RepID=UPI0019D02185